MPPTVGPRDTRVVLHAAALNGLAWLPQALGYGPQFIHTVGPMLLAAVLAQPCAHPIARLTVVPQHPAAIAVAP
eukprot:CAMPEP_0171078684 /NCGR_PEP_ID=MMETSP0766_2-20121228/14783_1 /TAXON_ID=439317 /ORGANISM="Gambierdiscus australes, Strain CAWD 149" /LENGTH=73 /DNA_ID=CAMNT_0011535827 /DNA_START=831 /DNA_END=1048 /DNA_ORIENTATION=-